MTRFVPRAIAPPALLAGVMLLLMPSGASAGDWLDGGYELGPCVGSAHLVLTRATSTPDAWGATYGIAPGIQGVSCWGGQQFRFGFVYGLDLGVNTDTVLSFRIPLGLVAGWKFDDKSFVALSPQWIQIEGPLLESNDADGPALRLTGRYGNFLADATLTLPKSFEGFLRYAFARAETGECWFAGVRLSRIAVDEPGRSFVVTNTDLVVGQLW